VESDLREEGRDVTRKELRLLRRSKVRADRVLNFFGKAVGGVRIILSTKVTNTSARAIYEAEGWKLQIDFCDYNLALTT